VSQTDEIKARVDIVDLIGESVSLRKSGRTFKAPCPFHAERTPSFVVDPARQSWRCFGACGEGGDIFSFVMKQRNVGFREALTMLAERAGVPLQPLDRHAEERERQLERLRSANEAAAAFFRQELLHAAEAEAARTYVEARGLNADTSEAFGLGYAPDSRDALQAHLRARGFSVEELLEGGLVSATEREPVDRFRDRLIFPIRDRRARCIGFGGRALGDAGPKYLNTAQKPVFDKSGTLYALERARDAAREADRIIIVEGYMDVLAAHQFGQHNVVAAMGTSLTDKQVALIKPITRNIVLALDADAAGAAATLRGIDTTRAAVGTESVPVLDGRGILRLQDDLAADIRILELPSGLDPDDLIRREPDRWNDLVERAPSYLDYRFARAKDAHNLHDARDRAAAVEELLPLVAAIAQPVVRSEYVARLAAVARTETSAIEAMLRRRGAGAGRRPLGGQVAPIGPIRRADRQAEFLIKLALVRPEILLDLPDDLPLYTTDAAAAQVLATCLDAGTEWRSLLEESLQPYVRELEEEAAHLAPFAEDEAHRAAREAVERLRQRLWREELRAASQDVAEEERTTRGDALTLAAAALDGDPSVAEIDPEAIDEQLKDAARRLLANRAKSRALYARRPPETVGPTGEGES